MYPSPLELMLLGHMNHKYKSCHFNLRNLALLSLGSQLQKGPHIHNSFPMYKSTWRHRHIWDYGGGSPRECPLHPIKQLIVT